MAEDPKMAADDVNDLDAADYIGDIEEMYEEYQVHTKLKPQQKS